MASRTADFLFEEMLQRLEQVSSRLKGKEAEVAGLHTRIAGLELALDRSKQETTAVREELAAEALKASLHEQQQQKLKDELQAVAGQAHAAMREHASLDRVLNVVQQELASTKEQLADKCRELDEQQSYWSSVLEARETSIASLQQLLAAQRAAAQEADAVWEEQRAMLKHTAEVATVAARKQSEQAGADEVAHLKARVLELEADVRSAEEAAKEAVERAAHLQSHLRERERLLVKSDKRYQELARQLQSMGGLEDDRVRSRDVAAARGAALDQALAQLREAAVDREALKAQFVVIQDAFEEERAKRERLRAKLAGKLAARDAEVAARTAEAAACAREAEQAQVEVMRLRVALDASLKEQDVRSEQGARQAQVLAAELEGMRARHEAAAAAARAALDAAVVQEAERHADHIKDLEAQLQRLASGGGPRGVEAEGAARALRSRCERLEREASSRAESLHQLQHSLYVVRAHWGGLAQGLARLARLASTRAPGALLDEAAADPSAQAHLPEQLAALGREWEPASKGALDKAVSESLGAGAAIVEAAADAFQAQSEALRHARMAAASGPAGPNHHTTSLTTNELFLSSTLAVASTSAAAAGGTGENVRQVLRLQELERQVRRLQEELQQARRTEAAASESVAAARLEAAGAAEHAAAVASEANALRQELWEEQEASGRLRGALKAAEAERDALRLSLSNLKNDAAAVSNAASSTALQSSRALEDAQASIAMLHARLEHAQAGTAQVEELKGRLRTIMASAQTPDLLPAAGPGAGPQQGGGRAGPAGLEQLAQAFMAALQGSAGVVPMGASGSGNVDAVTSAEGAASQLEGALAEALSCVRGAVAGTAVMDVALWEVARGVEGVGLARAHLGSVAGELASGRASTAAVLLQEVLGLMDAPAVGTSTAAAAAQGSGRTATSAAAQSPRVGRAGGVATGAAAGSGRLALVAAAQGGSGLGASAHGMAGGLDLARVQWEVEGARGVGSEMAACMKSAEAMLAALGRALPAYLQLTRAQAQAAVRAEMSQVKAQLASQQLAQPPAAIPAAAPAAPQSQAVVSTVPATAPATPGSPSAAAAAAMHHHTSQPQPSLHGTPAQHSLHAMYHHQQHSQEGGTQLLEPVEQITGSVFGIHRDMEALRRRAARLSHALASARRAARASARRTDQLLTALSASLPLPPDLLLALRRGVGADLAGAAQDTEGEAGVPAAEGVVRAEGRPQRKGRQGREEEEGAGSDGEVGRKTGREGTRRGLAASAGAARSLFATGKRRGTLEDAKGSGREVDGSWSEEEEEEEAGIDDAALEAAEREREEREQMFGAALLAMRDLLASFLAALEDEARASGRHEVIHTQVTPLDARVRELEVQLGEARTECSELAAQAAELVRSWSAAMEAARAEVGAAASEALEGALRSLKGEVADIRAALKRMSEGTEAALARAAGAAGSDVAEAAAAGVRAANALGSAGRALQEALAAEVAAHDSTASQVGGVGREASERAADAEVRLSRARTEMSALTARLSAAETAQEEAQSEAAELRRTLRSRDAVLMGLPATGAQQPAPQPPTRPAAGSASAQVPGSNSSAPASAPGSSR